MLSPLRADALDQHGHVADVQSDPPSPEWPYTKLVFATVLGAGYLCAFLALVYPFYMYMR
jgi:hypothetical protein